MAPSTVPQKRGPPVDRAADREAYLKSFAKHEAALQQTDAIKKAQAEAHALKQKELAAEQGPDAKEVTERSRISELALREKVKQIGKLDSHEISAKYNIDHDKVVMFTPADFLELASRPDPSEPEPKPKNLDAHFFNTTNKSQFQLEKEREFEKLFGEGADKLGEEYVKDGKSSKSCSILLIIIIIPCTHTNF